MTSCGARTRSGAPCKKQAGWGSDHLGEGRCRLHGGATPVRHGLRSKVPSRYKRARENLKHLIEEFENDPDPLGLLPELAVLRAVLHLHLDQAEGACPSCGRSDDYKIAANLIERIGRMVARIEKLRAKDSISRPELFDLVQRMALMVKWHVKDPEILEKIADDWYQLRLKPQGCRR